MPTICLFSELDPFTGEISFNIKNLEKTTKRLKLACLLYDQVIVNSNVLLTHPLCLPAFQKLKPFVQSGVLWTTSGTPNEGIEAFLLTQAKRVLQNANSDQVTQVDRMLEAWLSLTPKNWQMTRNAKKQVANATHNIAHNLQTLHLYAPSSRQALHRILDKTYQMQAEQRFSREELFALLSNMRGLIHNYDMAQIAMIVQGEYISQGTQNKGNDIISLYGSHLYGSGFAHRIHRQRHLFSAGMPHLDFYTESSIHCALQFSNYSLEKILALPTNGLYEFSQSLEWKQWRESVLNSPMKAKPLPLPFDLQRFFTNPKTYHDWNGISEPKPHISAQLLAQTPWLLNNLAVLGNLAIEKHTSKMEKTTPCLNIATPHTLSWQENTTLQEINLSQRETSLLMVLALFGIAGTPLSILCQMTMEVIKIADNQTLQWQSWLDLTSEAQASHINNLNVFKHRLNNRLRTSGIQIAVSKRKSLWHLQYQGNDVELPIRGTMWAQLDKDPPTNHLASITTSDKLTHRQRKAFQVLLQHAPNFVSAYLLADAIGEADAETKKISDMIYRMNRRIKGNFEIINNNKGEYRLLPVNN